MRTTGDMRWQPGAVSVERLDAVAYAIPTGDGPGAEGHGKATTVIVVEASAGKATGIGWTYGPAAAARVVTGLLAPAVTGRCVNDVPAAHLAMGRALREAGGGGLAAGALSAADIALWDLKARVAGLPLTALLGAAVPGVPVYGSGGPVHQGQAGMERELRGWVEERSIPRVKIEIGESAGRAPQRDLDRVHVAREVIGPVPELYVDAGGGYSVKQAVRIAEAFADDGVSWFEQPVPAAHPMALRQVRDAVTAEVTAGGDGRDLACLARMAQAGAVDCLQADVTRCGGITVWLRAAAVAEAHGLEISGRGAPHAHAHAAASVPNLRHVEWRRDHVVAETALFDGVLDPQGGTLDPAASGEPGLGLALRREHVRRCRVA
ncbi:enolase C-terminal domain-like protein [Streptomyces sp. NRRL F-5126]|uniref:enolase C-terminal domain-like protein n=1 Tax=Streptomyces sp. NRRL F-5126 TaxID=1463857 RepID=UPI000A9690F1|nr:enolase C-terminal domain-like protein [Streptomyces sp. NRRL F-5126]